MILDCLGIFLESIFLEDIFLEGIFLGGIFLEGIFLGGIFLGGIFLGGIFLEGIFLGGEEPAKVIVEWLFTVILDFFLEDDLGDEGGGGGTGYDLGDEGGGGGTGYNLGDEGEGICKTFLRFSNAGADGTNTLFNLWLTP